MIYRGKQMLPQHCLEDQVVGPQSGRGSREISAEAAGAFETGPLQGDPNRLWRGGGVLCVRREAAGRYMR